MSTSLTCYSFASIFCFFFAYFFNHFRILSPMIFLTIKLVSILISYRLRKEDQLKWYNILTIAFFTCFLKYFFLNYVFFGRLFISANDLIPRFLMLFSVSMIVLNIPIKMLDLLYKNDIIRTFILCGFGVSDAYSLNMITFNFLKYPERFSYYDHIVLMIITGCIGSLNGIINAILQRNKRDIQKYWDDLKFHGVLHLFLAVLNLIDVNYFKWDNIPGVEGNKFLEKSFKLLNITFMVILSGYKSVRLRAILPSLKKAEKIDVDKQKVN